MSRNPQRLSTVLSSHRASRQDVARLTAVIESQQQEEQHQQEQAEQGESTAILSDDTIQSPSATSSYSEESFALLAARRRVDEFVKDGVYLKYYYKVLILISCFYLFPSMQFVMFQISSNKGQLGETCYFNNKCIYPALGIPAFNNVSSNIAYLIMGLLFIAIIYFTKPKEDGIHGLHTDMSLYYSMGITIIVEGFCSGLYHICPSRMNFQFDTSFMLIGGGLLFTTLYQKRHATMTSGAFKTFGFFAAFILLGFISLVNPPATRPFQALVGFWMIVCVVFAFVSIAGSVYLYKEDTVVWDKSLIRDFFTCLRHPSFINNKPRMACIVAANTISWLIILYSFATTVQSGVKFGGAESFNVVFLGILVLNFMVYMIYYISMKFYYEEIEMTIPSLLKHWYIWVLSLEVIVVWMIAGYFFQVLAVTDKFASEATSDLLNKPCVLFNYWDDHDVWHILSSVGLISIMSLVYVLDLDVRNTRRTELYVF